jgi:hypothetical protein
MAWTHKHVRFQPTISAKRKRCRTTLPTNGPTIGANSPQTTARTHTPCKRTTPERGGTGLTVPFQPLLETVAGRNPLHHKAARGLLLGRRPILFGTVAYRWRRRTSGLRPVPWPCPQSFARSRGPNSLRSNGLGLCANNAGSEPCLWAVCKQCGLICCYCGSDVPRVCCQCGPTSALVCGPACG